VRADTPIAAFKRDFPLGAYQRVVVMDEGDRYAGIALPAEVHADADENHRVQDLLHHSDTVLLPQMTIKEAVAMFENAESDALAVVDGAETRRVIGLLTEQYALRRYSEPDPDFPDSRSMRLAQAASDKRLIAVCEATAWQRRTCHCIISALVAMMRLSASRISGMAGEDVMTTNIVVQEKNTDGMAFGFDLYQANFGKD